MVTPAEPVEGASDVIDLMEILKRRLQGEAEEDDRAGDAQPEDLREASKAELYARAQELDIPGRSGMSKDELVRAIRRTA